MSIATPATAGSAGTQPASMSQAECYQRLRAHLAFLRLPAAAEALPAVLDQTHLQNLPLPPALERLLAIEVELTEARRLASRLPFACLPTPWTLSDYNFSAQPGIDETLIRDLATLPFLDEAANVLFIAPARRGQDHARHRARPRRRRGRSPVYFTTADDPAPPGPPKPPGKAGGPPACGSSPDRNSASSTSWARASGSMKTPPPCSR